MQTFFVTVLLVSFGCSKEQSEPNRDPNRGPDQTDSGASGIDTDQPGDSGNADTGTPGSVDSPADAIGDTLETAEPVGDWESWSSEFPLAIDAMDYAGDRDVYEVQLARDTIAFLSARSLGGTDLQMRVLTPTGTMVGLNQVMPHYVQGTDPGVWLHARGPAPVYVEVSAESEYEGRAEYELHGLIVEAQDGEPNNSVSEAAERLSDGTAGFRSSVIGEASHSEFLGWMNESGDVDFWSFDAPSTGMMAWSMWTVASPLIEPEMVLIDPYGQEIAWSSDTYFNGSGTWFDDVGILAPVTAGQRYTLKVSNSRPAFGAGTLYVGVATMVASPPSESEPNDDGGMANWFSLSESSVHPGYRSGSMRGQLDGFDAADTVRIQLTEPGYLSAYLQAGTVGSGLQPKLSIWADPYGVEVLAEAPAPEGTDGSLQDVYVAGTEAYVRVEAISRRSETYGNHYVLGAEVYPVPLHD